MFILQSDLQFLGKYWKLAGRPTFCMILREDNIRFHHFERIKNAP